MPACSYRNWFEAGCIYKVDFVLASNERIVDVSDGMTIIMDEYKILHG